MCHQNTVQYVRQDLAKHCNISIVDVTRNSTMRTINKFDLNFYQYYIKYYNFAGNAWKLTAACLIVVFIL